MQFKKPTIITTACHSIHLNLAFEQFLFEKCSIHRPLMFLWSNNKNVVIGRHQNPWKECKLQEMENDNVQLSRRKSGGGAVYQDLGNHCFTFLNPVTSQDDPKNINNELLIQCLKEFKISGVLAGRNDIHVDGKKVSGSAYQLSLGTKSSPTRLALHHGTMLINVEFNAMTKYLSPSKLKLISKGVDSVRQRVLNLKEVNPDIDTGKWEQQLIKEFSKRQPESLDILSIDESEMLKFEDVKKEFSYLTSWDWLYQYSPDFSNNIEKKFNWGLVDIYMKVESVQGVIKEGQVFSDCLVTDLIGDMNSIIKSGKITYDFNGVKELCSQLRKMNGKENEEYISDLEKWLYSSI